MQYLHSFLPGDMFVLGALTGDHWFVFIADRYLRAAVETNDRMLDVSGLASGDGKCRAGVPSRVRRGWGWEWGGNVVGSVSQQHVRTVTPLLVRQLMMFDVDQSVAALFYRDDDADASSPSLACEKVTTVSGIDEIFPGAHIHGWVFAPCGYSCNGIVDSAYFTIHVTPQEKSSYVSFGTNVKLSNYNEVVAKVLAIFRPQVRCTHFPAACPVQLRWVITWVFTLPLHSVLCLRAAAIYNDDVRGSARSEGD